MNHVSSIVNAFVHPVNRLIPAWKFCMHIVSYHSFIHSSCSTLRWLWWSTRYEAALISHLFCRFLFSALLCLAFGCGCVTGMGIYTVDWWILGVLTFTFVSVSRLTHVWLLLFVSRARWWRAWVAPWTWCPVMAPRSSSPWSTLPRSVKVTFKSF